MFKELFLNFTTLITFIYLISQFFIYISDFKFKNININININMNVCYGIAGGLLAILLMSMSIRISDSIIFDFRHLTILVVATFGGLSSAIITGSIIFIFRLFYLGVTVDSILIAFNMLIVSIGCGIISKLKIKRWIKWIYMNIFASLMISISFWTRIPDKNVAVNTILIFCSSSIIVGSIVYFVTRYILLSEKLFRKYKHEAKYDYLTGIKNIRAFNYFVENIEDLLEDNCKSVSIFFIDIDFFKAINDTYGHDAGDVVLQEFGKVLKDLFRFSDLIFRVGGEEFVVILPNCKDSTAIEIAERVRSTYENYIFNKKDTAKIKLTVSIGIASSTIAIDNDNVKSLITKADRALYKAKENGRNRIEVYV